MADIVVDEFERIYRSPGARLAFLRSARAIYLESPAKFYPRLATLQPPALFVWASHDRLIPERFRPHVERWLPSAEQVVLEGCGHVPQIERPERTNGLLERSSRVSTRSADGCKLHDRATTNGHSPGPRRTRAGRVPAADLDERDPDYIRETLPRLWLLSSLYFRGEVRGLGNVPEEGPVLLVGNHSGGNLTPDTHVFTLAFSTYFGVERAFHQLAHNLVLTFPGLSFLRKYGTVAASQENARRALESGAAVLVYPAATTRSTGRRGSATGSTSAAARASSGSPSSRTCRSCRSSPSAGRRRRCS